MPQTKINRKYKDTVFRALFKDKENLLSLYNALNDSNYTNTDDLQITTIDDVIYMGMKNDLSFIIDDSLTLIEHQSTYSPNLPLRGLLYLARVYDGIIGDNKIIYTGCKLMVPRPSYYVIYNGEKNLPEKFDLKLSDLFETKDKKISNDVDLECIAHVINVNYGKNKKLLNACQILKEYATLIKEIRNRKVKGKVTKKSIDDAVDYCIENNILKDFLLKHKGEVRGMYLTDYDPEGVAEAFQQVAREEGLREGREEGLQEGRQEGIKIGEQDMLFKLVKTGKLSKEDALENSTNKKELEKLLDTL